MIIAAFLLLLTLATLTGCAAIWFIITSLDDLLEKKDPSDEM